MTFIADPCEVRGHVGTPRPDFEPVAVADEEEVLCECDMDFGTVCRWCG